MGLREAIVKDKIILQREFLLRDAEGRNVDVVAKLRSLGGQTPGFSITCQNGSAHDLILASAPNDVRADIEALILAHGCDESGVPIHAAANAAYFLGDAKFDNAAAVLHGVVPVEELYVVFGECTRRAEDPATMNAYLETVAGRARLAARAIERQRHATVPAMRFKSTREAIDKVARMLLLGSVTDAEVILFAEGKFSDKIRSGLKASLKKGIFEDAVSTLVAERCFPVWRERAEKAKGVLARPDYRYEGRPPIDLDPTTFKGFAAKYGLELAGISNKRPDGEVKDKFRWDCLLVGKAWRETDSELKKGLNSLVLPFTAAVGSEPTLEDILEHMQMEFADVTVYSCDEFLENLGFSGGVKEVRQGEQAYWAVKDWLVRFKKVLAGDEIDPVTGLSGGDLAFQEFVTSVGDNPPLTNDFFEEAPSPSPAP